MKKVRIGVVGVGRGRSMIKYCKMADNAELVAICDKWAEGIESAKRDNADADIAYYSDFDAFLNHDMDAVVLANYANEHAPFAIKAMRAGKHVFSEVLPCQTMQEAVALIETVEQTGRIYAYGENYCYMPGPYEMRRLYRECRIGEFEYGEGEYIHNCEPIWPEITYGEEGHWRNNMYSTFYCTHSMGPLIHITGLRPVSVVGLEGPLNDKNHRTGAKGGSFGIEMVTLENGAVVKSIHGCFLHKDSIWYTVYGTKGRMETAREDARLKDVRHLYVNADEVEGVYEKKEPESYKPARAYDEQATGFGHGGSDFYSMWHFAEKVKGNPEADIIDVYEAMDMFLPGLFAYRSILNGGAPTAIPDLRDRSVREQYRNDTACVDPKAAGDQLLPTCKSGTPDFGASPYAEMERRWREKLAQKAKK